MLQFAAILLFASAAVGMLVGFAMQNRVPPYRDRGVRLLAASSALMLVVVTATLVVKSSSRFETTRPSLLTRDFNPSPGFAFGKPSTDWSSEPLQNDTPPNPSTKPKR